MANIKIPTKKFEKHFKLTNEIKHKIPMLGTPLETYNKNEIELEIFPNRPDMLSYQGFIRAFKSFMDKETGLKKYKINKPEKNFEVKIDSSVKDIRPFTACAIVKNLKFDDEKIKEIIDIQEKLHSTVGRNRKKLAIGIYPLEKIKLPIRYTALPPQEIKFQPLEFPREITGQQILSQHPAGRDYGNLLEGKNKFPVFIDANNEILSMPPIINSHNTGKINENTKEIFIECSGFDFDILSKTLNIIVTTLADMGGDIYQMELNYNSGKGNGINSSSIKGGRDGLLRGTIKGKTTTPNLTPEKIKINLDNIENLLGIKLKEAEVKKLLEKMGYNYSNKTVEIPAYRTDILHEVDIIEDIAIAYGYDNFKPTIPDVATIGQEDPKQTFKNKITEILTGLGFLETYSYTLTKKQDQFEKMNKEPKEIIELVDSKTEYNILKQDLLHTSLRTLSENSDSEYPQKIFEIAPIFMKNDLKETGIQEQENLVISISPSNFTEIKQVLNYLGEMLDLKFELKQKDYTQFIQGRVGEIYLNHKMIGLIGEVCPYVQKNWKIKMPTSSLELNLNALFKEVQN
ncbi:MAG: phenylalanine--tRNA ligase subunit beta [Nanoarchaeota archaeon]|nr:phenylalanine--tRNA ligase subunit beta [Nanoarchaeota archaeon]